MSDPSDALEPGASGETHAPEPRQSGEVAALAAQQDAETDAADDEDNETEEDSADPGEVVKAPFRVAAWLAEAVAHAIPTPDDTEENNATDDE